ncbi:dihydrofolate reductase [Wenyingzhuangia sp. 2_MG-2023]|uniref:dihydrofolate reductase n=1 Tax=Wenyingzhuangia sp. 2_MG-2023 TaxID=3062639 RepID=UPI0026E16B52|nr:dihydrofolate reductase [Wenyingzhuangia sp. 2_MG-2023]MDO6737920.1 dihydrofolate reductase [Wenyingzhuangia sp. 2_MG-2023]MDO6802726.1 dihydrofolate reductase [Wenyingzhuangia sp. 1_MG-2023]
MTTIIAAVGENNELGKDNDLIWHLPADLKRFKKVTTGHHIIMGRNTYESIGKPLPNRTTIIISRNNNYKADGCIITDSLEKALEISKTDDNAYVIGGAQIYKEAIELVDVLDLCEIHRTFNADTFFPEIDKTIWKEIKRESFSADKENEYDFSFVKYKRR